MNKSAYNILGFFSLMILIAGLFIGKKRGYWTPFRLRIFYCVCLSPTIIFYAVYVVFFFNKTPTEKIIFLLVGLLLIAALIVSTSFVFVSQNLKISSKCCTDSKDKDNEHDKRVEK